MEGSAKRRRISENDGIATSASYSHPSTEGGETALSSGSDYEVFLSFRGPDTRSGFTDFLYTNLTDAGIRTFKDDEDLRKGEEFAPKLLQAIKQSKILIPIFSKNYASSAWCLKELVQMVECKKTGRQKIMPIFYDVAPSEVRHQTGGYGEAFSSHKNKKRYDQETIKAWEDALNAVPAIGGWDLYSMSDRKREGELAKTITQKVFGELKKACLVVSKSDCLVNVDNRVDAIMELIGAQTSETRIIGIHGMGGIGKTTIAKIIYSRLSSDFENCCFLPDIREMSARKGIECLQHQLISSILKNKCTDTTTIDDGMMTMKDRLSNKRVLLLLDDMHEKRQMDVLVGEREWFGKGSKLIITTRNIEVLDVLKVDACYELMGMDRNQSLQLFSKHAFRRDYPLDEYVHVSNKVIRIARGLPLTLEVIGSTLSSIDKTKWDDTLKKLENVPHRDVRRKLKISYDELDYRQKLIFLDIACHFIGYDKDILVHFWDEPNFFPEDDMEVLQSMSLIKITESNCVWMHDQLKDLGREIVCEESNVKIEMQRRVWDPKEALNLLRKPKGKKGVEALRLELDSQKQYRFSYESFESLSNLRFLEVDGPMENFCAEKRLLWHESRSDVFPTNENSDLLPQLRWLSWCDIPPAFNITNFLMEDVVILNLSQSKITDDWKGWRHMEVMKNLKVLDLSSCNGLQRTPIFSSHPNLERLILCNCQSLIEIDASISHLKCLVSLDISYCQNLPRLPDELGKGLANLKYLSLGFCTLLKRLPDSIGNLESLIKLDISCTSIKKLPDSIENLKKLEIVKMEGNELSKIPDVLWSMGNLKDFAASRFGNGNFHVNIGNGIYKSQSLKTLILKRADIYELPRLPESLIKLQLSDLRMDTFPDLSNLTNLKDMDLGFGRPDHDGISNGLGEHPMPRWIGNLSKLEFLALRSPYVTTSPTGLTLPPRLNSLTLHCRNLRRLPGLPSSLFSLHLEECESLCSMENLSNLKKLSSLCIRSAAIAEIQGLGCLENLQDLTLLCLTQVEILPDLGKLNKLRNLFIGSCNKLVEIQGQLPRFFDHFNVGYCGSLQKLPDLSSLMGKQKFEIHNCNKLNVEAILVIARKNPRHFKFVGFEQLQILPDLSNSNELRNLEVKRCDNLVEIQGKLPRSLEVLEIYWCRSLRKLHDLSSLIRLREVSIQNCDNLIEIPEELPQSLEVLGIDSCKSLQKLPNLSSLSGLREVCINHCSNLIEIQGELPQSLEKLVIRLVSLQKLPYLSSLIRLREVCIQFCNEFVEIPGELPQFLEVLEINSSCKSSQKLLRLSRLKGLREVSIGYCNDLVEIQGGLPESLKKLVISCCGSLQELPNLSSLIGLQQVSIKNCDNLVGIPGELPQSLENLEICECQSLRELPNLSRLKGLRWVKIKRCKELNVQAISSLCLEKSEKSDIFVGADDESESESQEDE